jgi:hypothetical protein
LPDCYFIYGANPGGLEEARKIVREFANAIANVRGVDLRRSRAYFNSKPLRVYVFVHLPLDFIDVTGSARLRRIQDALNMSYRKREISKKPLKPPRLVTRLL